MDVCVFVSWFSICLAQRNAYTPISGSYPNRCAAWKSSTFASVVFVSAVCRRMSYGSGRRVSKYCPGGDSACSRMWKERGGRGRRALLPRGDECQSWEARGPFLPRKARLENSLPLLPLFIITIIRVVESASPVLSIPLALCFCYRAWTGVAVSGHLEPADSPATADMRLLVPRGSCIAFSEPGSMSMQAALSFWPDATTYVPYWLRRWGQLLISPRQFLAFSRKNPIIDPGRRCPGRL